MILADTGFWLALANQNDDHHVSAKNILPSLREPLLVTWPVFTETCHLLANRLGHEALLAFVGSAADRAFVTFDLSERHYQRLAAFMVKYRDLPMDLADASLVVAAEDLNEGRIFSTDKCDFKAYRWKSRKPFNNLLIP